MIRRDRVLEVFSKLTYEAFDFPRTNEICFLRKRFNRQGRMLVEYGTLIFFLGGLLAGPEGFGPSTFGLRVSTPPLMDPPLYLSKLRAQQRMC